MIRGFVDQGMPGRARSAWLRSESKAHRITVPLGGEFIGVKRLRFLWNFGAAYAVSRSWRGQPGARAACAARFWSGPPFKTAGDGMIVLPFLPKNYVDKHNKI